MLITGLGPHGEKAAPADKVGLTAKETAAANSSQFRVALVLHTTTSDWSCLQVATIRATLGAYAASIAEIVDCTYDKAMQNRELLRLASTNVNAVISIPIGVAGVTDAHREISRSGKKLVLLDNVPTGLLPGVDYSAVVSADNFNLGQIAASLLSADIPEEGVIGILTYVADCFAANEREIAFRKWMAVNRPDLTLVRGPISSTPH